MGFFKRVNLASAIVTGVACLFSTALADSKLSVQISVANGILSGSIDGRVVLMFAPNGTDPLDDTDVISTPNKMFGKNVFDFGAEDSVTLYGGSPDNTKTGVYGFPLVSMDEIPPGTYRVQAFLNPYDKVSRSDGSVVHLKFPCGDGAPNIDGVGSLVTTAVDVEVDGGPQIINLSFDSVTPVAAFAGKEIGGCSQGNYVDTTLLKFVKIRSEKLSEFWGRDMYVGANVLLPSGYNATDKNTRYPVIYSQGHWQGGRGAFRYPTAAFSAAWDKGIIPGTNGAADRPTPKMIMITFRHEAPYYDDSYAVNTANMGPYGDAINEELIPYLDATFNTIAKPYARIQEGGSTGGWESAASLVFRPDLFGACFSSYPDSLDFHRHQDIQLYTNENAYTNGDGSAIPSIRDFENGVEVVLATVAQENHWELVFGTSTRSSLQWDVWNAVFGIQGLNGYPLEPWDKVTGEIYSEAVDYWKEMDLADYIVSNWDNGKKLGETLRGRIFIYVGSWDDYYLNEGVMEFEKRVNGIGGANWANVTILAGKPHGGNYQTREIWNYLEFLSSFIQDHSPEGKTPLSSGVTRPSSRGNKFDDVIQVGGHGAALKRQEDPTIDVQNRVKCGPKITATVGRWDPGVTLLAQWVVNGQPRGTPFAVKQGDVIRYASATNEKKYDLKLQVTGTKRNYDDETRESKTVTIDW